MLVGRPQVVDEIASKRPVAHMLRSDRVSLQDRVSGEAGLAVHHLSGCRADPEVRLSLTRCDPRDVDQLSTREHVARMPQLQAHFDRVDFRVHSVELGLEGVPVLRDAGGGLSSLGQVRFRLRTIPKARPRNGRAKVHGAPQCTHRQIICGQMRFEIIQGLARHVTSRTKRPFVQPDPAEIPTSGGLQDRRLSPLGSDQLTLNSAPTKVMVPEQVRGHSRHMAGPKHQRFSSKNVFTLRYVAEHDQVTEDLRKDITQGREPRILPQPLGSLDARPEVEKCRRLSCRDQCRPARHGRLLKGKTKAGNRRVTGVEFGSLVTVRLACQLDDLYTEYFGKLTNDTHAIKRKTPSFDLGDPAHGAIDSNRQLRLIPSETPPCPCYALPRGQFSPHHEFPSTLRRYPRRSTALSVKVTVDAANRRPAGPSYGFLYLIKPRRSGGEG